MSDEVRKKHLDVQLLANTQMFFYVAYCLNPYWEEGLSSFFNRPDQTTGLPA